MNDYEKILKALRELTKKENADVRTIKIDVVDDSEDESVIHFIGSDATTDRANEIMTLDGWDLTNYSKNPVFLYAHDYSSTPIGKSIKTGVSPKGLEFWIKFVPKEIDPFAEKVRLLYKEKFLNAVSVGFDPLQYQNNPDGTRSIIRKELLELSGVPVPCNPNALQDAMRKGIINEADMKRFESKSGSHDHIQAVLDCYKTQIDNHEKQISTHKNQIKKLLKALSEHDDKLKEIMDGISNEDIPENNSGKDEETAKEIATQNIKSLMDEYFPVVKEKSILTQAEKDILSDLTKK